MLEAKFRDINKKGRTFRNSGFVTGTIKRKDGEIIPISMIGYKLETYIKRNGFNKNIPISFNDDEFEVKIDRVQRDTITHNIINIDTLEV